MQPVNDQESPHNDEMVWMMCIDDRFAMPLAVTARSAIDHCKSVARIHLFIVSPDISAANQRRVEASLIDSRLIVHWVNFDPKKIEHFKPYDHLRAEAYIRIFAGDLLPSWAKKLIYLDSDLVVLEDLHSLWQKSMGDFCIMACQDQTCFFVSDRLGLQGFEEDGIPAGHKYFNSGLMLINLEQWRKEDLSSKLFAYALANQARIRWMDQDCMNALLWNRWEELNPAWNVQVGAFYRQQGLLDDEHRPELYVDVIKKPKVIHYNTDNKPWLPGCIHPLRGEYFRHLKRTAWQGTRPNELAYRLRKSASKIYRYFRPKKTSPSSDPR